MRRAGHRAPKPTKADAQKVVQIISNDKGKTQAYCDLNKVYDQMQTADQNKDSNKVEALGKQADALSDKLGPEYNNLMDRPSYPDRHAEYKMDESRRWRKTCAGRRRY